MTQLFKKEHLHQLYKIPSHFTFWKKGGYSKIYNFYNEIIKVIPKFIIEDNFLNLQFTSFMEVVVSLYLPRISYFIECHNIYTCKDNFYIYQEYKGTNLYDWKNQTSLEERIKSLPTIISQLVNLCIFLENHGIYHSDLTLNNIIFNKNIIYLIDYSCISLQVLNENNLIWTQGIGTWNYSAPETIFDSNINDNSNVWSIGMLICELLDNYPLNNTYYPKLKLINKREYWQKLYHSLYNSDNSSIAFLNSYENIPSIWKELVCKMICWDPIKRISKEDLLLLLNDFTQPINNSIIIQDSKLALPYHSKNYRDKYIQRIYEFAKSSNQLYNLANTIYIWDLYSYKISKSNVKLCLCAAWILNSLIFGTYNSENISFTNLYAIFKIKYKDIYPYIWKIGEYTSWNIYQPPTDVLIYKQCNNIHWDIFIKYYIAYTKPYNSKSLFEDFLQKIQ